MRREGDGEGNQTLSKLDGVQFCVCELEQEGAHAKLYTVELSGEAVSSDILNDVLLSGYALSKKGKFR